MPVTQRDDYGFVYNLSFPISFTFTRYGFCLARLGLVSTKYSASGPNSTGVTVHMDNSGDTMWCALGK